MGHWVTVAAILTCLVLCLASAEKGRIALVVTLAGNKKLADYFEWSCRSIGASKGLVDMLVFHEHNQKVLGMNCAENVKLVDLGEKGLSGIISNHMIPEGPSAQESRNELRMMLAEILVHMPRYLVEIKPMTGSLFAQYLSNYTHWSYTDPDIVWGNLEDWIDPQDLKTYDLVSVAKNWDAARLYLRGQVGVKSTS